MRVQVPDSPSKAFSIWLIARLTSPLAARKSVLAVDAGTKADAVEATTKGAHNACLEKRMVQREKFKTLKDDLTVSCQLETLGCPSVPDLSMCSTRPVFEGSAHLVSTEDRHVDAAAHWYALSEQYKLWMANTPSSQ